jgi:parallel beta-helix repeat protein
LVRARKNRQIRSEQKMTNTQTTTRRTNRYYLRVLALMAAMVASLLVASAARPSHASTTFTVNTSQDAHDTFPGDGICDSDGVSGPGDDTHTCTLRAAIQESNASTTEVDTINFNIPEGFRDPASGVVTISPNSALPPITEQVTIDGYTQPGAHPNTKTVGNDAALKIELDGHNSVSFGNGLEIESTDGSVIRGLVINRFDSGIMIHGDSAGNRIEANFIGTDPTGTLDRGNINDGVTISDGPSESMVGGTTPAARNVISGNSDTGILVVNANGNRIQGNYVGTDKSGTKDLGNTDGGVSMFDTTGNTVGGTTTTSRNVISGNDLDGIRISGSQETRVLGNRIGTTASGKGPLGNSVFGVRILDSSNNLLGDGTADGSNTIAFNGRDGVEALKLGISTTGNKISRNVIFSNAGLGIDLMGPGENDDTDVSTLNDAGDADFGPNNLQNKPLISSAKTGGGKTTIKGKLDSAPNQSYTIEFYSNPSGTNEGKKFIGEKGITTSIDGIRSFTFSPATAVSVGQTITATATRVSTGDTSEFSTPKKVASS